MNVRWMKWSARRLVMSGTVALMLAVCLSGVLFLALNGRRLPRTSVPVVDAATNVSSKNSARLNLRWQIPSRKTKDLWFSSDGNYIAYIDKAGIARSYDSDGMLQWGRKLPDPAINYLLTGPGGKITAAFSLLNPTKTRIYFIGSDGSVIWKRDVDGAPWCSAVSPDGDQFVIGTGEGYVYVFTIREKTRRYARWRTEGVPTSISFDSPDEILVGTWQQSFIGLYRLDGTQEWILPADEDKLHFVQTDERGESVLSLAVPNRRVPFAGLTLLDKTGAMLWRKQLDGSEMRAAISRTGRYSAIGYLASIEHNDKEVAERRVAFFDDAGSMLWNKGGIFFKPRLLGVISENAVLVYDEKFLYILNRNGKAVVKDKLQAPLVDAWSSASVDKVIVECSNGRLYCYSVK